MERTMTVEEKIRRAEEIYERRKQGEVRPVTKVNVNDKKDIKLLKKMIIQILICVAIFLIIYTIQNSKYVFSEDFISRANGILSYDTNFWELYEMTKENVINFLKEESEQELEQKQEETINEGSSEAIGGAEETQKEQVEENLSQEEIDIQSIKNTATFIKPVEGVISSKYGIRDTATGSVPKNHTGTDIAANLGTKIIAATDGEVVLASEEGDYRQTFKNSNW
jgi:hypothetical protein